MNGKSVRESTVKIVQQMVQADANLAGNVHGGVIMRLIDNTAGIVASRHSACNSVTASIDRLDFHNPVYVGDLLVLTASINYAGMSSMEIGVRVEAENFITGQTRHTASAYLTFVALGSDGKPARVPPLVLESDGEKRRNAEARERRKQRLAERARERAAHGKA
ncbi:MAG TPA: acyl-CoA thioesterase [Spirochaetota bacterium]|nr:acyl-CoA thioesterase [Spirochaetota bacterium]